MEIQKICKDCGFVVELDTNLNEWFAKEPVGMVAEEGQPPHKCYHCNPGDHFTYLSKVGLFKSHVPMDPLELITKKITPDEAP